MLLLRCNQGAEGFCEIIEVGYFDVPRFEIDFGSNPEEVIKDKFAKYFNQKVLGVKVIDVCQSVVQEDSIQVFEIVYAVQCDDALSTEESVGKFLFADISNLESYMLEHHHKFVTSYLR